VNWLYKTFLKA